MLDLHSDFGKRVEQRLREERVIWLTTVASDGTPQPVPVWFLWDGTTILIYSQPDKPKLRHIGRDGRVSLNFDSDGQGGNIVVLTGDAVIATDAPKATEVPAYVTKYREGIQRIGMSPEAFAAGYSIAIHVTPTHVRGH